jgi:simple sugar transport system permease protein
MKQVISKAAQNLGVPRLVILCFFLFLLAAAIPLKLNMGDLLSASFVRILMWGVLVLAILPSIVCGTGPNFGLSLGILCGLLGGLIAMELELTGFANFGGAILFSLPIAALVGWGYGWLLNRVKGSEMMFAMFVGWSAVSLMKIGWLLLPFRNPEMAWPIGRGVRVTISLLNFKVSQLLNNFLSFKVLNVTIPTGLVLFFILCALIVWVFMRSKAGLAMYAAGDNPRFAEAAGIHVDRHRTLGIIVSTMLGAVGILVYAQSFGFYQLYEGPMFMPIAAVAAILIGGASIRKASMAHVVIGVILFQGILVVAMPVFNLFTQDMSSMGEISRVIIQNGIILYALAQVRGD